jgi:hypothetical protein
MSSTGFDASHTAKSFAKTKVPHLHIESKPRKEKKTEEVKVIESSFQQKLVPI